VSGTISSAGTFSGSVNGLTFAASRVDGSAAGFYQAPAVNGGSGTIYTIVGGDRRAVVVAERGNSADGGSGVLQADGTLTMTTKMGAQLNAVVNSGTGAISATADKGVLANLTFSGVRDDVTHTDRLADISTRGRTSLGDQVMIAGFIISGTTPHQVLIRAIGPTLSDYGVNGILADPRLELYRGSTKIAESDNWGAEADAATTAATASRLGAFNLSPSSKDAVLLVTLDPGPYTAQVSGLNATSGVALVEVYDAEEAQPTLLTPKLANISTRGLVGTDDEILIAGIVVGGNAPKRVLVRAVGPALGPLGVNGVLEDPVLTILSGSTVIAQNDDWTNDPELVEVSNSIGAFALPTGSKDAAMLITLSPGNYTAQVRGKNGTKGIALVEIYDAPQQ
jgi:hypothetical protein